MKPAIIPYQQKEWMKGSNEGMIRNALNPFLGAGLMAK